MRVVKIFVSSPGDVQPERKVAEELIRSVAKAHGVPVSVTYNSLLTASAAKTEGSTQAASDSSEGASEPVTIARPDAAAEASFGERLILCPYFWEYQRFELRKSYQAQVPDLATFHLVICMLWSRLGTELGPEFTLPDGSRPRSGTEYEIGWARHQAEKSGGIPELHVYWNKSPRTVYLSADSNPGESLRQWNALQSFLAELERSSTGHFRGAFNNYQTQQEFEELFRKHFEDFLLTKLNEAERVQALTRKVKLWAGNPFRGLQVFEYEHREVFFGRTTAAWETLQALSQQADKRRPFLLVLGASGSGKSSLVRAGLLPLLVQPGSIDGIGLWRRAVMRPAETASDPLDALAAALLESNALPELKRRQSDNPVQLLAQQIRDYPASLGVRIDDMLHTVASDWVREQARALESKEAKLRAEGREIEADVTRQELENLTEPRAGLVLVIDQLEEVFVSGYSERDSECIR